MSGNLPPGVTQAELDRALEGDDEPLAPTPEEERIEAWEYWHQRALAAEAERATLRRELAARAIRLMGPRSPYWNCTICGAAKMTPILFEHKPGCLLADTPHPTALVPESE